MGRMKRIREYLNGNAVLPRKVIIFSIAAVVLAASILFGRVYRQKNWEKRVFLAQIANELYDMKDCIEWLLEDDVSIEKAEKYCTYLLTAISQFEATSRAGYYFVSEQIHCWGDLERGFDGVRMVIWGSPEFKIEPLAIDGISQNERLFLQELLTVVKKLLEPYERYADGTATAASSLRVFSRAYSSFVDEWWVDGNRIPGVSPFDRLKQPE